MARNIFINRWKDKRSEFYCKRNVFKSVLNDTSRGNKHAIRIEFNRTEVIQLEV